MERRAGGWKEPLSMVKALVAVDGLYRCSNPTAQSFQASCPPRNPHIPGVMGGIVSIKLPGDLRYPGVSRFGFAFSLNEEM